MSRRRPARFALSKLDKAGCSALPNYHPKTPNPTTPPPPPPTKTSTLPFTTAVMRIVMARISEKGLALPRRVAIEAVPAVAVCSAAAVGCGR